MWSFILQVLTVARVGPGYIHSPELSSPLLHGWQGPKYFWCQLLFLSQEELAGSLV